jgi:hypothetical protein
MCSVTLLSFADRPFPTLFEASCSAVPLFYLQTGRSHFRSMGGGLDALGLPPPLQPPSPAPTES